MMGIICPACRIEFNQKEAGGFDHRLFCCIAGIEQSICSILYSLQWGLLLPYGLLYAYARPAKGGIAAGKRLRK